MSTLGTYYLNAPSLSSATTAYTDAALTIVATDGWYSDSVTVRQLVGGLFTDIISSCAPCASPCTLTPVIYFGDPALIDMYRELGSTTLDVGAIIIEIEQGVGIEYPLGVFIDYDGVKYNTFSSQVFGFVQGPVNEPVYIGDAALDCGIVAAGLQSVPIYEYNSVTDIFDNTGQFVSVQALAPQVQLSPGSPGKFIMVIPKPTPSPSTLYFQGRVLCGAGGLNAFGVTVKCPAALPSMTSTVNCALQIDTCSLGTDQTYYSADVNGSTASGGSLGFYDWVFSDPYGQNVLPDGWYRSPSVLSPATSFEVQNGTIINFGTCGAVTGYPIDYEVENAILGSCAANVSSLTLSISQPPIAPFVNVIAPSTGTQNVPSGITRVQLTIDWSNLFPVPPCGAIKMIIEKDNVIIASKTFTPTVALIDYLDVDFNLNASATIYGYVTLA